MRESMDGHAHSCALGGPSCNKGFGAVGVAPFFLCGKHLALLIILLKGATFLKIARYSNLPKR